MLPTPTLSHKHTDTQTRRHTHSHTLGFSLKQLLLSESSTRITNFMLPLLPPLLLSINIIKQESRIGHPQKLNWDLPDWLPMVTTTTLSCYWEKSYYFIYPSIKYWNNAEDILLPWNCATVLKSHTHQQEHHQPSVDDTC